MKTLARIRVRETHGIRRFLYPMKLSPGMGIVIEEDIDLAKIGLISAGDGTSYPMQISQVGSQDEIESVRRSGWRCEAIIHFHFAVSLGPFEELELHVVSGIEPVSLPDPLCLTVGADNSVQSRQDRFQIDIDTSVQVSSVVYEEVRHLKGASRFTRNGETAKIDATSSYENTLFNAHVGARGIYSDGASAYSSAEITACKSWLKMEHLVIATKTHDEFQFELPFAVTGSTLLYDIGVGGGIYGKINETATWRNEFHADGQVTWSVYNGGRLDYQGRTANDAQFASQLWFHIVDTDKALAVAITHCPKVKQWPHIDVMEIKLNADGMVIVRYVLGEVAIGIPNDPGMASNTFGICYHFLNDVPAISAATNPQSILLSPQLALLQNGSDTPPRQ